MNATRLMVAAAVVAALLISLAGGCSKHSDSVSSASDAVVVIEPNVSVGKVHAGMTMKEVTAALGEPERRTANALEYTHLGFAVVPGKGDVVQVVMCGDVTGVNGPLVKACKVRTREGIGMNSTRDEVIKALGEPTRAEKRLAGLESLKYDQLGITFSLDGGRVHHMIVVLGAPAQ